MRPLRIYVDTSVIGGCFDAEFATWSNGLVQDFIQGRYRLVVSEVVVAEIGGAPPLVQAKLHELLLLAHEMLEISEESLELVGAYARHGILPPQFRNDMLHIALATTANADVLVSWNFKHIVRLEKIRIYNAVNLELGYKTLQIRSPREVTSHEG